MRRIFNLLLPLTLALGLSVEAYAIEASSTPLPGAQIGIAYLNHLLSPSLYAKNSHSTFGYALFGT